MVYSLEVTLTVEYAESGGTDNTMREKVSHVGQGLVNGALEQALWLGRAPPTPLYFSSYSFREQISVSTVSI